MKGKFDLAYFIKGAGIEDFYKALGTGWRLALIGILLFFLIMGVRGCFVKEPKNVNKPINFVSPFAKVEKIDQTSTQFNFEEKKWEVSFGGAALTYDNKNGLLVGGMIKRKF